MRFRIACAALAAASVPLLRDAAAHEDPDTFHWETEGVYDGDRADVAYHWDVQSDEDYWGFGGMGTGRLEYGTNNAYWGNCFDLWVEGVEFAGSTYSLQFDDRGLATSEEVADDLAIVREIYAPPAGMDFVRYVDTLRNDSASTQTYTIEYRCTLGTILGGVPTNFSSDGDATFDATDTWVGTDLDSDDQPAVAFVVQSEAPDVGVDRYAMDGGSDDRVYFSFELELAADETAALMVFGVQAQDEASATATAEALTELPDEAIAWAEDDMDLVRNWMLAPPGAPVVRTNGPYSVDEGDTVGLAATVNDLEGDAVSFAWDLDGDGAFDDSFVLDPEVSAFGVDGPADLRVALWASDGVNEVVRATTVRVRNVAPTITSDPGESATTGELYTYQVTGTDPAGAADPFDYTAIGPPGMVVNAAGRLTWTPDEAEAATAVWAIELVVEDGDGGTDTQEWSIVLGGAPHVTVPEDFEVAEGGEVTLRVEVVDSEGDPTTVEWDLDRDGSFDDADGTEAVFSAVGEDGPDDSPFARVLVSDGTWNVVERVNVFVENAPPIFDSEPEREARAGATWTYEVRAHDPGGDEWELEVDAEELPEGMVWDPKTATFTWLVDGSHVAGSPWVFEVGARDDEDDVARQGVSITIVENFAPSAPRPIYPTPESPSLVLRPTLKAGNATDLDEDPLTYFFELDADPGFRSIELAESGPVEEGPGVTEWYLPRPLRAGGTYYWRVWANDGIEDSEKTVSFFEVQIDTGDAGPPDGGGDGDDGGGGAGCVCRTAGGSPAIGAVLALCLALVATRRRRSGS